MLTPRQKSVLRDYRGVQETNSCNVSLLDASPDFEKLPPNEQEQLLKRLLDAQNAYDRIAYGDLEEERVVEPDWMAELPDVVVVHVDHLPREEQEPGEGVEIVESHKEFDWLDTWSCTLKGSPQEIVSTLVAWKTLEVRPVPFGEEEALNHVKHNWEEPDED